MALTAEIWHDAPMQNPRTERPVPTRNRRDIGRVVNLADKMDAARDLSGCCVGVEALLEADATGKGFIERIMERIGRAR